MRFTLRGSIFLVLLGPFALAGCGATSAGYPVAGKVTVDGSPLTRGAIRFVPDKTKNNLSPHESIGSIGADGSYSISTNGQPGAPLGWYKVTVTATDEPDSTKPNAVKSYVAKRFAAPESTNVSVEVVATPAPGAYDVKVSAH